MDLKYPHCTKCLCPLIWFRTDKRTHVLCVRCHEDMCRTGPRSTGRTCACGQVETCQQCRSREHKYLWRLREELPRPPPINRVPGFWEW